MADARRVASATATAPAATALRKAGLRTQLYAEKKKFKQRMAYADKIGAPFVVLLGEDEIAQGKLSVKDMHSGEQQLLDTQAAAALIRERLAPRQARPVIAE